MMAVKGRAGAGAILQLQIKQRRTPAGTDILYQVLWPKERKGESVLLRQDAGGSQSAVLYFPSGQSRKLRSSQMGESLLEGDLSYEDAVENFFAWKNQALAGSETVNGVTCVILESKPESPGQSIYGSVRSWIDTKRSVPLRIEKFLPSGSLARRIDTTRVASDDEGRPIPADLAVHDADGASETDLDGSRIRHDVIYSDTDFTPGAMKELSPPRAAAN
jgi:hypothetical protein